MKRNLLVFVLVLMSGIQLYAQDLQWIASLDRLDNSSGTGVAIDPANNIYSTGNYFDTLVVGTDTLISRGNQDIFLVRHDAGGNVVWVRTMGSKLLDESTSIAVDHNNHIIITGGVHDSLHIDGAVYTPSSINQTLFIARYDSLGTLIDIDFIPNIAFCIAYSIAVDDDNSLVLTGKFLGEMLKDSVSLSSPAGKTFFILKVSPTGIFTWAKMCTESGNVGVDIAIGDDAYFVTGSYGDGAIFDVLPVYAFGNNHNLFVVSYSKDGTFNWIRTQNSGGELHGMSIAINDAGKLLVGGEFASWIDTLGLGSKGSFDVLLLGYDSQGNLEWSRQHGGKNFDSPAAMTSDGIDFYVTGIFSDTTDFGDTTVIVSGANASFIEKLDDKGNLLFLRQLRSAATVESYDIFWHDSTLAVAGKFFQHIISDNAGIPFDTLYADVNKKYFCALFKDTLADVTIGVGETLKRDFKLFPNPSSNGILYIVVPEGLFDVQIFVRDVMGRAVKAVVKAGKRLPVYNITLDNYQSGIYFISVVAGDQYYLTKKLLIN